MAADGGDAGGVGGALIPLKCRTWGLSGLDAHSLPWDDPALTHCTTNTPSSIWPQQRVGGFQSGPVPRRGGTGRRVARRNAPSVIKSRMNVPMWSPVGSRPLWTPTERGPLKSFLSILPRLSVVRPGTQGYDTRYPRLSTHT